MTHHAYLIVGALEDGIAHARTLAGGTEEAHPDLHILTYETFGIDEARMIQTWAYQKPVARATRHFIIACDRITHETQNALLKLFEEPPQTSAFALVVRDEESILPTLRSRFAVVRLTERAVDSTAADFLKRSYAARLEEVASRTKAKDALWQRELLAGLEAYFRKAEDWRSLGEIAEVAGMIGARGASPKMLLEHLALALPRSA